MFSRMAVLLFLIVSLALFAGTQAQYGDEAPLGYALKKRFRGEPIRFGKRAPREPLRFGKRSAPAAFELFSDEGDY